MMRLRSAMRRDDGLTLVELLVAMVLLGVLLAVISGLYSSALRAVTQARGQTGNTKIASTIMNETARVIRAGTENPLTPPALPAPAFVYANKDDILLYAYINLTSSTEQPQLIRLRVDTTTRNIIESRWPATPATGGRWTFPANPCVTTNTPSGCTAPTTVSTLGGVIPASHTEVFKFFTSDGTPIPVPSNGLSATDRALVASVKVTIVVQPTLTDSTNPVTLENQVGMPNLGFAEEN